MNELLNPKDIVGISFWLLTLGMFGVGVFLLAERKRMRPEWQSTIALSGIIALISGLNYFFMGKNWVAKNELSTIYRFADWQLTIPMQVTCFYLILCSQKESQVSPALFWRLIVSSAISVAAAYLGAADYISPTLGFLFSLGGGLYIIGELFLGEAGEKNTKSDNPHFQSSFNANRLIVTIGWAIHPLGYFMEYLGGGVDSGAINLIYNLSDFLNKIAFGLVIYVLANRDTLTKKSTRGDI